MRFMLTIDRGNTAIKAALWTADGMLVAAEKGDESRPAAAIVEQMAKHVPNGAAIEAIAWCTVVASDHADDAASLAECGVERVVELTHNTPTPVSLCYLTPSTLGTDRIAAVLGAVEICPEGTPVLVADIGTAVTYEYVDADRRYIGGNIAPGIDLRLRALAAFTDALPAVRAEGEVPLWGQSTADAMRSGAVRGIAAELQYYLAKADEGTHVVLTGGSAPLLINDNILPFDFTHDPFLVHKGLYSIIKDEN